MFTDRDGNPTEVGEPPPAGSHYGSIGAFQAETYHRNAFALGTTQEVDVLAQVLDLPAGGRLLDVGCGNGRHVTAFAGRGVRAVGLDLSPELLIPANPAEGARGRSLFTAGRSESLPFGPATFDGLISVCQGGFGLSLDHDQQAMTEWHRVLRPGGRVALTAFSLVFAARFMGEGESLDLRRGLHHHVADVRGPDGERRTFDLWTAAYTVPHITLLLDRAGFAVLGTAGVEPGGFQTTRSPTISDPEMLVWAQRR